jgi:hypothetical protein
MGQMTEDNLMSRMTNLLIANRWRKLAGRLARFSWIVLIALTVILTIRSIPDRIGMVQQTLDERSLNELGISSGFYVSILVGLNIFVTVIHLLISTSLFIRRRNDAMALFVSFALLSNGALIPLNLTDFFTGSSGLAWYLGFGMIKFVALTTSFGLLFLFPTATFLPRGSIWIGGIWMLLAFFSAFLPGSGLNLANWNIRLQILVLLIVGGFGIGSQLYRFLRRASSLERQQIKWASAGILAAFAGPFVYFSTVFLIPPGETASVPNILYQRVGASYFAFSLAVDLGIQVVVSLILLVLPFSFAIAILRYRLWDIDIIIRRTMIYSGLTGGLAIIYLTSVLVLQQVFRGFTDRSQLAIVLSTLISVMVARPLWRRIQDGIDRNFYRSRYDAEITLSEFSIALRREVEIERLSQFLIAAVQRTVQPENTALWLRSAHGEGLSRQELLQLIDDSDYGI